MPEKSFLRPHFEVNPLHRAVLIEESTNHFSNNAVFGRDIDVNKQLTCSLKLLFAKAVTGWSSFKHVKSILVL